MRKDSWEVTNIRLVTFRCVWSKLTTTPPARPTFRLFSFSFRFVKLSARVCVYDKHLTRNARQTLITLVISRQTRVAV